MKKPGDKIDRDEPLFEISTDKVDAEIPAPSAGVLKEIKVTEGQTVPIQTIVAVIDADGAGAAPAAPAAAAKTEAPKAAPAPAQEAAKPAAPSAPPRQAPRPAPAPPASAPPASHEGAGSKVRSSPLVRRIARENNVDLSQVPGTGAGGRVSKHDIVAAVGSGGASAPAAPSFSAVRLLPSCSGGGTAHAVLESAVPREKMYFGHYEVQPMSVMRQRIAEHMVMSKRVRRTSIRRRSRRH